MIFEETLFDKYYKKYHTTKKGYCYTHLDPYKVTTKQLHDLVDLFYNDTAYVLNKYFSRYIVEEILLKIWSKHGGILAYKTWNYTIEENFNEIDKYIKGVLKILKKLFNVLGR